MTTEDIFHISSDTDVIVSFRAKYGFMSNFSRSPIVVEGEECATVEHAYQMLKTLDPIQREAVRLKANPHWAKQASRAKSFVVRADWPKIHVQVMRELIDQKFDAHPQLAAKLLATGDRVLAEGNDWNDRYWGVCQDEDGAWSGRNLLGVLLMQVRKKLRGNDS